MEGKEKINVVIYARYSSHNQREESIEGQIKVCKEYAKQNNFTIIHEYIDRAMTGTNDNREQFHNIILIIYVVLYLLILLKKLFLIL